MVVPLVLLSVLQACRSRSEAFPNQNDDSLKAQRCGNGVCSGNETCSTCPADCGQCPPICGDGACNGTEPCSTCAGDCGTCPVTASCGDGTCNGTETCSTCPGDCGTCPVSASCGDGACNGTETCSTCPGDCGTCPVTAGCGDGFCSGAETCSTCAVDCGGCLSMASCGDGICYGAETCITCPVDCSASCTPPASCGDATCSSPTTGRIAFVSDRTGTKLIYVANPDGSGATPLTTGEAPAWSADGGKIAFHRSGTGIYVIDANGANEHFLRAGGFPTWSPDGTKMAYQAGDGIYVMNADGSNPRLLISNEFASTGWGDYGVSSPAWSPDGQTIAFVRANYEEPFAIYTMRADGSGEPTPVPTGWAQDQPAWSPDGSRIAFETAGYWVDPNTNALSSADQVASATPSGSYLEVYVTSGTRGYVGDPTWSPDGRSLLFTANSSLGTPTRLYLVREDGSVAQLIPEASSPAKPDYRDSEPAWSWGP